MTKIKMEKWELAQILPIVVLGLVAIIAMAALILDGGALLLNRRTAQNAADAGALAGARIFCNGGSTEDIDLAVNEYVTYNNAILTEWYPDSSRVGDDPGDIEGLTMGEIVVATELNPHSYFAGILGRNNLKSTATARAGCFPSRGNIVLPIAWSCRAPAAGSASEDCDYIKLNYDDVIGIVDDYLYPFPLPYGSNPSPEDAEAVSDALFAEYSSEIYVIVDSNKTCGVDIVCDFNTSDTIDRYQLSSGGNRGWLNLTGVSSGTPNLEDWIDIGVSDPVYIHSWLTGIDGNRPPVYSALSRRIDEIVWIPVFNVMCPNYPITNDCLEAAHSTTPPGVPLGPDDVERAIPGSPAEPLHHVVAFAPFLITCVHARPADQCPGFDLAKSVNPDLKANTNSVEGYFIDPVLIPEEISFGGADLGIYTVSLTE